MSSAPPSYNRLAVYAHRGWASSAIVASLAGSGAPVKVLYRPGSDIPDLPKNVETVQVDLADEDALVAALADVDILLSFVGHSGVLLQKHMIAAVARAPSVKLFVPSDLAARYDALGTDNIPVNKQKAEIEQLAREKGVPTSVVLTGNFDAFALGTPLLGIDLSGNRILHTGDSEKHLMSVCTRAYVGAAHAQLFARTPISQLANRSITLREYTFTGSELVSALTRAHNGQAPTVLGHTPIEALEGAIKAGHPLGLAYVCRRNWGAGLAMKVLTDDVFEVEGYTKATLESQVVEKKVEKYRELPEEVKAAALAM